MVVSDIFTGKMGHVFHLEQLLIFMDESGHPKRDVNKCCLRGLIASRVKHLGGLGEL